MTPHDVISDLAELVLPRHVRRGALGRLVLLGLHGILLLRVPLLDLAGVLVVQDQMLQCSAGVHQGIEVVLLDEVPQREV